MDDEFDDDDEIRLGPNFPFNETAECFGGPVDGSFLPVPSFGDMRAEIGTVVSGHNHKTGDTMHYRLEAVVNEETGEDKLIYQFVALEHTPGIGFDEFMRKSEEFQSRIDDENN